MERQNNQESNEKVIYLDCTRNFAVAEKRYVTDGCNEFAAEEENVEYCTACGCHRSFHRRREIPKTHNHQAPQPPAVPWGWGGMSMGGWTGGNGVAPSAPYRPSLPMMNIGGKMQGVFPDPLPPAPNCNLQAQCPPFGGSNRMLVPYAGAPATTHCAGASGGEIGFRNQRRKLMESATEVARREHAAAAAENRRVRKLKREQKEKMRNFADRVIQQDDPLRLAVSQFCDSIGMEQASFEAFLNNRKASTMKKQGKASAPSDGAAQATGAPSSSTLAPNQLSAKAAGKGKEAAEAAAADKDGDDHRADEEAEAEADKGGESGDNRSG